MYYGTDSIAILLATYNGEKYIEEQLNSLLNQTYSEWVAFIHDDGSSDGTVRIIKKYSELYPQKFVVADGAGTGGARNNFLYLLNCVEAPYYMFCDQDDVWLPDKIERTYGAIKEMKADNPNLVFTNLKVVKANLDIISEDICDYQKLDCTHLNMERLIIQNVGFGCTMLFNKSLRDKTVMYKNADNIIMHDWWIMLVAAQFGELRFLNEATMLYRQHDNNDVGAQKAGLKLYFRKFLCGSGKIKHSIELTRIQAKEFSEAYGQDEKSVVSQYAASGGLPKLQRMAMYKRYGIRKTPLARNVGFIIWG